LLGLLAVLPLLGLAGFFGQETVESVAASPTARLRVEAPDSLRGGLLGQGKFTITARADIAHATLVLDHGWTEGLQLNTIEPNPLGKADRGDRLALDFGHVPAGANLVARIQFQVDPTSVGRRSQGVALYDGKRKIVAVKRTITIFP
jgi:hypothetical protein